MNIQTPEGREEFLGIVVDALLSGEYKQGKQRLKKEVDGEIRYCCLGVITDKAIEHDVIPGLRWESILDYEGEAVFTAVVGSAGGSYAGLIRPLRKPLGMDIHSGLGSIPDGFLIGDEYYLSLAEANDQGASFEDIAQVIREKLIEGESNV